MTFPLHFKGPLIGLISGHEGLVRKHLEFLENRQSCNLGKTPAMVEDWLDTNPPPGDLRTWFLLEAGRLSGHKSSHSLLFEPWTASDS